MRVPAGRAVSQVPGDAAHDCADVGTHRLVRRCRSCQCHELAESRGLVGDRIGQPGAQAGSSSGGQGRQRERSGRNPGDDGIPPVHVGQRSEELGAVIAGECRDLRRRPTISQQPLPEPTGARGAARPARDQTGERGADRLTEGAVLVHQGAQGSAIRHRHLAVDEQVEGGRTGLHGLDRRSATIGGIGRPGQPAAASVHDGKAEVLYFEAADKYLRVLTAGAEYLIRTPLKELMAQLDPQVFWQIHRGTVVRASLIDTVTRDEAGKLSLSLRGRPERLAVSRLYAHLFRAM